MSAPSPPRELIDAALECLELYGPRRTTLVDVARRAGVSRSSIYRIFGSKPQLLAAVATAEVQRFFGEAMERLDLSAPLERRVPDAIEFTLDWLVAHRALQRALAEDPQEVVDLIVERPGGRSPFALSLATLTPLIAAHPEADRLVLTPEQTAEWMLRAVYSVLLAPTTALGDHRAIAELTAAGLVRQ